MIFHSGTKLSDIAEAHSGLSDVLARYGLGPEAGERTLGEACADAGLNARLLPVILGAYSDPGRFPAVKLGTFPVPQIIDFLEKTHRHYIYRRLPAMERGIYDLAMEGVLQAEKLEQVNALMVRFKAGLQEHIGQEEAQLFPYILYLHDVGYHEFNIAELQEKMENNIIGRFACEHDEIGRRLRVIMEQLADEDRSSASRSRICGPLLKELEGFERDLLVHGRIEDEVLLRRAALLEQEIRDQVS